MTTVEPPLAAADLAAAPRVAPGLGASPGTPAGAVAAHPRPPLTQLAEEERLFAESVREFARDRLTPRVRGMDERGRLDDALLPELFELGLMSIEIPEEHGGAGANFMMAILAVEELSRVDPAVGVVVDVQNTLVNNCLLRWGSPEQIARYAPRLAADTVGAYALSEPSSGSDAFALATRAERVGDRFVLNGTKLWITNGQEAGLYVVFATLDRSKGYRGITAFLVERDFPGFEVGKKEDKLGIRASSTTELLLHDCEVPAANVLGEEGRGYRVSIETLNEGRIGIGAQMVGLASGALEKAVAYAREREAFGRSIAEFQAVQHELAAMALDVEAARLLVYNAARLKEAGASFVSEAAMAKLFSSRVAERVASTAIEIFGGYGFTRDYAVEKLFRDSKIGSIYEGTSNMQLSTIAKALLR
ncbi:MAG: acyl-CoA dehydrogenase [Gemmatimonadetes bacterium]|nr:acyl-CoA dehydrogenase [Gemmatimonadota bacterium]